MDKGKSLDKPVVFLSASMPKVGRDPKFLKTADFTAIRDAVVGLINAIIPDFKMVWGGHPAITPIIANIFEKRGYKDEKLVTLYQSKFFTSVFPEEDKAFSNLVLTKIEQDPNGKDDMNLSLRLMRRKMIGENNIVAAIFIGGMEGILYEANIVKDLKPQAKLFPVASTGGASLEFYNDIIKDHDEFLDRELHYDMAYTSMFKTLLYSLK